MTCSVTINLGTSMTFVVRICLFIVFVLLLLIPNNNVCISTRINYSHADTQAVMVSISYMLTQYCISNVRFDKIKQDCQSKQRPRWQVDKEAIGLSRVQHF